MRELHVLGVSDDGDSLLLGTSATGKVTHRVALDSRLRQAVRGQLAAPGEERAESVLTPKEMQARMRAGATPDEVAKAAHVPVARVLPYFAPVEAERERIVEEARRGVLHRARGPQSTQPLGEVVDARLREVSGLKDDSVGWTARRRADGAWVVRLTYAARGSRRTAEWLWQPADRHLTALDASATRLAAETPAVAKKRPARRAAAAPVKKATPAKAKKAAPVKKAAPKRATPAKKVAAPKKVATPKKVAIVKPPRVVKKAAPKPARPRVLEVVPDPVPIEPPPEPTVAEARRGRVPVPSWSDVLLGVSGAKPRPAEPDRETRSTTRRRTSTGGRRRRG